MPIIGHARPMRELLQIVEHARHLDCRGDAGARHDETAECRQRHHDGHRQQQRNGAPVGRVEPQPEMDADAGVHPHDDEQQALRQRARRPQPRELVHVEVVHAEEHVRDARVDDVGEQKKRD